MKILRRGVALLLSVALVTGLVAGGFLIRAIADTAMQWKNADYDALSRFYEIGKEYDPGIIATTPGDPGGKSYGMYMFASRAGTPHSFAEWCKKSDSSVYRDIGETLDYAYHYITSGYGTYFDNAWKSVANTYKDTFGKAQYDYTRATFYDKVVSLVENSVSGFDIDSYSVALKNVFWSRAVQHGPSDAASLIKKAFTSLGGFAGQAEGELIEAIYAECGRLVTAEELKSENGRTGELMSGDTSNKYSTTGRILRYFFGSSGDVQIGVYRRLAVNEPADALVMLMNNGYDEALLADGNYQLLLNSGDQKLAIDTASGSIKLNVRTEDATGQTFSLTYYDGGFYTLNTVLEGQTLRLSAGKKGVSLDTPSTSSTQKWILEQGKSGYLLKNVSTETYLGCENDTLVMTAAAEDVALTEWRPTALANSTADWTMRGVIYPTSDNVLISGNSSFPVRGVVSCSSPITSINISISGRNGVVISQSASPRDTSYDLKKLDDSVAYSKLSAGDYTFTLTAAANGKTFELVKSSFTVRSNSGSIHDDETFTITFDPNGGTLKGSSTKTVSLGDIVYGELPTAVRKGYSFIGWFTEKEGGEQISAATKIIASDMTLYAQYADEYTYTFLDADGDVYKRGTVAEGELIPAPTVPPIKSPDKQYTYTFKGWEGYTAGATVMLDEDMTFKPLYDATPLDELGGLDDPDIDYLLFLVPGATVEDLEDAAIVYSGSTRVTSGLLATGMTVVAEGETFALVVIGDTNGDGKVTVTDVVALQSHVVGKKALEGVYELAADLNLDGNVTITDVVKAARVVIGKDTIS